MPAPAPPPRSAESPPPGSEHAPRPRSADAPPPGREDALWRAFLERDARMDGRFVAAVRTTGIYCRPTCTCRKPRRENVAFFRSAADAARAGFRACKRCRPELAGGSARAARDLAERALACMRAGALRGGALRVADLARAAALSPSRFARVFRAADGRTPMRALADVRAERAAVLLRGGATVLDAALGSGFGTPAALGRAFRRRFGEAPSQLRTRLPRRRRTA